MRIERWTPQTWIDGWNSAYRTALAGLIRHLHQINARLGYEAVRADPIDGGWYLPLRLARRLLPGAASSVDAFAALLHYGGHQPDSGIALPPRRQQLGQRREAGRVRPGGELFGHRIGPDEHSGSFLLRGTLAAGDRELHRFFARIGQATAVWSGPDGPK